jgi:hypothetical protein
MAPNASSTQCCTFHSFPLDISSNLNESVYSYRNGVLKLTVFRSLHISPYCSTVTVVAVVAVLVISLLSSLRTFNHLTSVSATHVRFNSKYFIFAICVKLHLQTMYYILYVCMYVLMYIYILCTYAPRFTCLVETRHQSPI